MLEYTRKNNSGVGGGLEIGTESNLLACCASHILFHLHNIPQKYSAQPFWNIFQVSISYKRYDQHLMVFFLNIEHSKTKLSHFLPTHKSKLDWATWCFHPLSKIIRDSALEKEEWTMGSSIIISGRGVDTSDNVSQGTEIHLQEEWVILLKCMKRGDAMNQRWWCTVRFLRW